MQPRSFSSNRDDPTMTPRSPAFSLAYFSVAPMSAIDTLTLAERAGYDHTGIRLAPLLSPDEAPLLMDRRLVREFVARLSDSPVTVFDVEVVKLTTEFSLAGHEALLEVGAALGARAVLVIGEDPDHGRMTDSFAALCDSCARYGLTANLEFMPWTQVPDLASAIGIAAAAGRSNGRILVDSLHVARSAPLPGGLGSIPPALMHYAQICDGPAAAPGTMEGLMNAARYERLLPGEGGLDLVSMFSQLPSELPISVEIPNPRRMAEMRAEQWARRALLAARAVIAQSRPPT